MYSQLLSLLVFMVITFVMSSLSVYSLAYLAIKPDKEDMLKYLAISAPFGPCLISFAVYLLMYLIPLQSDFFYIAAVFVLLSACMAYSCLNFSIILEPYRQLLSIYHKGKLSKVLLVVLILLIISLFIITAFSPIFANDPLQYFLEGRYLYLEKDSSLYPFTSYLTGYYSQTRHPPFYSVLITWSYFFLEDPNITLFGRLISPFFIIYGALIFIAMSGAKHRSTALLSALATYGTPLVYMLVSVSHIDVFRLTTYLASACWIYMVSKKGKTSIAIVAGVAVGLSMRVHASAILLFPFLGVGYLIISQDKLSRKVVLSLFMILGMLLACGADYYRNIMVYGDIISGTEEVLDVYSIEGLNYGEYIDIRRDIDTIPSIILNGILKGFTDIGFFGFAYWLAGISIMMILRSRKFTKMELIYLFQVLLFYSVVLISVLLGKNFIIKNSRYFLMVQPFVAYFAAVGFYEIYKKAFYR